jgi:hypothetical protein
MIEEEQESLSKIENKKTESRVEVKSINDRIL